MSERHAALELLEVGHCVHPEHVVLQNRRLRPLRLPAIVGLIEHPSEGPILYDTGYSPRFFEATRPFPERLYAWVTPFTLEPERTAVAQLARRGVAPGDVRWVIVSHFHADHVAGLRDFPNARFLYFQDALAAFAGLGRVRGTAKGFLRALLPPDLEARARALDRWERTVALPPECAPFERGIDLFGDGALVAVPLPGHVDGQLGLFVRGADGSRDFLVADACWTSSSYRERQMPHPITRALFSSYRTYEETLGRIADLAERSPAIRIVPAHCDEVRRARIGERAAS